MTDVVSPRLAAALMVTAVVAAAPAHAQGTLSTQGFGYPAGGVSTRAAGTAGAFAEFDALSTWNPASIGGVARAVLAAQTEPEYRTLQLGDVSERSRVQRVPLVLALFPLPRRTGFSLSAGTFLDRTGAITTQGTVDLGDEVVGVTDVRSVRGAISELRAAVGHRLNDKVSLGLAGHLYVGSNEVAISRTFDDTVRFGSVVDSSNVSYTGTGISLGADWRVAKTLSLSASYRLGNDINTRSGRTLLSEAKAPNRVGATLRYDGIPGSVFAAGVERIDWSSLGKLGSSDVGATDATNWHAGLEMVGPSLRQWPTQFRVGYANAQLPFAVNGTPVKEHRVGGGMGIPIAREFGTIDFSLQRAWRRLPGSDIRENAWRVGIGVQIRP